MSLACDLRLKIVKSGLLSRIIRRYSSGGKGNVADPLPGFATLTQSSPTDYHVAYSLNGSPSAFVFNQIDFLEADGASLAQNLIFAAKGPAGAQLKVEVVDTAGLTADFLVNLTAGYQNFTLDLSGNNIPRALTARKLTSSRL